MVNDTRDEWSFQFALRTKDAAAPIGRERATRLLLGAITQWAERHDLGIGGGLSAREPADAASVDDEQCDQWNFAFELCPDAETESIDEVTARELMALIEAWAARHGLETAGGFGPFSDGDTDPFPYKN